MVTVVAARSPEQLDGFRVLVREFVTWAIETNGSPCGKVPPVFANLENELAALPGKYAPPDGEILLAYAGDQLVGCIAGFRRDERSMEVTRLWARASGRGRGVGKNLVQTLLHHARQAGYERVVLRSHKDLAAAHKVYRKAGFADMDGAGCFPG